MEGSPVEERLQVRQQAVEAMGVLIDVGRGREQGREAFGPRQGLDAVPLPLSKLAERSEREDPLAAPR